MPTNTTRVWELTAREAVTELLLDDRSSMDAISRQLPEGFYTTFRTYAGGTRVVGLTAHLDRLYGPATAMDLQPACNTKDLRRSLDRLLELFRPQETRIRISLDVSTGHFFVAILPLELPPPETYELGVRVVTTQVQRDAPLLKKTSFITESQTERTSVARASALEGLIVQAGRILEGLTSNFFYVREQDLGTAGRGVLRGVTRGEILRIAQEELSLRIRYRALRLVEVPLIQEAFISSSSRGIVPVVQIDVDCIGSGSVGLLTKRLMHAYRQGVLLRAEAICEA